MKFHWGHGVGVLYASFVAFMLFLVYKTSTVDLSLVTKDYYKDEIEYQQRIDKKRNSAALADKLNIQWLHEENKVRVSFPKGITSVSGEILLYRPSDSEQDLKIPIQPNAENFQDVSFASLKKGLWRVKVEWKSGDKEYLDEKPLIIQ